MLLDGLLTDVSDRKAAEARLQHLADHDALTGLLNRRRFMEELELEIAVVRRGMRTARRSCSTSTASSTSTTPSAIRPETRCCGRSRACSASACARATRSPAWAATSSPSCCAARPPRARRRSPASCSPRCAATRSPLGDDRARVTASAGVAGLEEGEDASAEAVLSAADIAMYEGKHGGRDRVERFTPRLRAELERGRTLLARLGHALEHDGFALLAQPVLDLRTGDDHPARAAAAPPRRRRRARRAGRVPARGGALRPRRGDRPLGAARARWSCCATPPRRASCSR